LRLVAFQVSLPIAQVFQVNRVGVHRAMEQPYEGWVGQNVSHAGLAQRSNSWRGQLEKAHLASRFKRRGQPFLFFG